MNEMIHDDDDDEEAPAFSLLNPLNTYISCSFRYFYIPVLLLPPSLIRFPFLILDDVVVFVASNNIYTCI